MVETLGGTITVQSCGLQQGSTFSVSLPVKAVHTMLTGSQTGVTRAKCELYSSGASAVVHDSAAAGVLTACNTPVATAAHLKSGGMMTSIIPPASVMSSASVTDSAGEILQHRLESIDDATSNSISTTTDSSSNSSNSGFSGSTQQAAVPGCVGSSNSSSASATAVAVSDACKGEALIVDDSVLNARLLQRMVLKGTQLTSVIAGKAAILSCIKF